MRRRTMWFETHIQIGYELRFAWRMWFAIRRATRVAKRTRLRTGVIRFAEGIVRSPSTWSSEAVRHERDIESDSGISRTG